MTTAISMLRFPLTVMIVMFHCYCFLPLPSDSRLCMLLLYPFGLTLGETGVPAFFFISGYLFFFSQKTYKRKLQSRISTLLVPYILWNSVILLAYLILMLTGHPQDIAGKSLSDFHLLDYVRAYIDRGNWDNGNGQPMLCPYWYVRNLMCLCIISPLLSLLIRRLKIVFISILFIWWMLIPYNGMIASSFLFFCLGAYFSIHQSNPLSLFDKKMYRRLFFCQYGVMFLLDWTGHTLFLLPYGLYVHRIVLVENIFLMLYLVQFLNPVYYRKLKDLGGQSFWIYTIHFPIVIGIRGVSNHYFMDYGSWWLFGLYWLSVCFVTYLCLLGYRLTKRFSPRFLRLATGKR